MTKMNKLLKSFKYLPHTVLGILFALMLLEIKLAVELAVSLKEAPMARLSSHGNRLCELWEWGHGQYA